MNGMARSFFVSAMVVTLGLSGCNFPVARPTPTGLPSDTPVTIVTKVSPAETKTAKPPTPAGKPADTEVPTIAPIDTPASPVASANDMDVACRFGPGDEFSIEGAVRVGEQVDVLAQNKSGDWLQIENPRRAGKLCWIPLAQVVLTGELALAPKLPKPLSIVTAVDVVMDPLTMSISPCVFPVTFDVEFSITTTGPTTVTFYRFLDNGSQAPPESVVFSSAQTQVFQDYYRASSAGEGWFGVHVTSPNDMQGVGYGTVVCP